jgi:hypothetical protein
MSTSMTAPRLRPHFTPEPRRWIKAFLAHPYLIAEQISRSAHHKAGSSLSVMAGAMGGALVGRIVGGVGRNEIAQLIDAHL